MKIWEIKSMGINQAKIKSILSLDETNSEEISLLEKEFNNNNTDEIIKTEEKEHKNKSHASCISSINLLEYLYRIYYY